jgi:hypothetical protein
VVRSLFRQDLYQWNFFDSTLSADFCAFWSSSDALLPSEGTCMQGSPLIRT